MKAFDTRGNLKNLFFDDDRKISDEKRKTQCKLQYGTQTCRYIVLGEAGFVCMKGTELQLSIDNLVMKKQMVARGDNCPGLNKVDNATKKEK